MRGACVDAGEEGAAKPLGKCSLFVMLGSGLISYKEGGETLMGCKRILLVDFQGRVVFICNSGDGTRGLFATQAKKVPKLRAPPAPGRVRNTMATAINIMKQLQSALTCYICEKSFLNPATLDCGHNFCHSCLLSYWQECGPEAACPRCQEKILRMDFPLNRQLVNIVKVTRELDDQVRRAAGRQERCKKHQEALQSFCMDDLAPFCLACDTSQEHRFHDVLPVVEAAQLYKQHFSICAEILKEEKEKLYKHDSAEQTECMRLSKRMVEEKNSVVAELEALKEFIAKQENVLLTHVMEKTEKAMAWCKTVQAARLFREELAFDDIIQELKERDGEPPFEFLQGIRSPVEKCRKKFLGIKTFPVQLKMDIWDLLDFNFFLRTVVKQFKEIVLLGYRVQKANVTLDPDTAHPRLILSEDRKSLQLGREHQNFPEEDQRFDLITCVLGCEQFVITGRYTWDVITGRGGSWAVGVARRSLRRKGMSAFGTEEGVWVMLKSHRMYGFINGLNYELVPIHWFITRIRVYLNYPAGRIAFCDPDSGILLHEFIGILHRGEPLLPFFWIYGEAQLSLVP